MSDDSRRRGGIDDRADIALPVTSEIGSEGGSYGDPTQQVATFSGEDGIGRSDDSSIAAYATDFESSAAGGVGASPAPAEGMVRYPTEPPYRPSASPGRRFTTRFWRPAIAGAAAGALGAAVMMGLARLRRSRTRRSHAS